jgi:hypothetical protein
MNQAPGPKAHSLLAHVLTSFDRHFPGTILAIGQQHESAQGSAISVRASYLRVSPKVKAQADAAEAAALPDMPMRFTCLRSSRLAIRAAEF